MLHVMTGLLCVGSMGVMYGRMTGRVPPPQWVIDSLGLQGGERGAAPPVRQPGPGPVERST
jgi:hypothetical protein